MRHAISRLLAQFETFRAEMAKGESRDLSAVSIAQFAQIPIYVYEMSKARWW